MGSLTGCLKKFGIAKGSLEEKTLRSAINIYRKDGHDAQSATERSIRDMLNEYISERDDVVAQVKGASKFTL